MAIFMMGSGVTVEMAHLQDSRVLAAAKWKCLSAEPYASRSGV